MILHLSNNRDGIFTVCRLVQLLKALLSIVSILFSILIDFNLEQPENASTPIDDTLCIVILYKFVLFLNASFDITILSVVVFDTCFINTLIDTSSAVISPIAVATISGVIP